MKKFFVSLCFVFGFTAYAFNQKYVNADNTFVNQDTTTTVTPTQPTQQQNPVSAPTQNPVAQPTSNNSGNSVVSVKSPSRHRREGGDDEGGGDDGGSVASAPANQVPVSVVPSTPVAVSPTPVVTPPPAPTPAPVPQGKYRNGTYTGSVADASYGLVQVEAVITNGKISDVIFLNYPNDRPQSQRKSANAMPILKQEAISIQSENVDAVSGASYTSAAFVESLGSALAQAKV